MLLKEERNIIDLTGLKPEDGHCNGQNNRNGVVVAMTSWTRRIHQVPQAIRGFLDNTMVPDFIYLSLSTEEFPNRERDLPDSLLRCLRNPRVKFNWVEGPNTKPWKKVFPVLKYLDDDDLILMVDDDCIIDPNLVETRVSEFHSHNGRFAISGGGCYKNTHLNVPLVDGYTYNTICPTSLVQKRMLRGWERFMTDQVISTYHDDCLYSILCLMNGFRIVPSKSLHISRDKELEVNGMHLTGVCKGDKDTIPIIVNAYETATGQKFTDRLFNLVIWDSFNLAGDNGEYLYRKIRELYPNINMTFVLSRTSQDWERLSDDGFNLYPFEGDMLEYLLQSASWILWSKQPSHFDKDVKFSADGILSRYKDKSVFLQHGVTSDISTPGWYFRKVISQESKYVVATSEKEAALVRRMAGEGIDVVLSGFPRWDFLLEKHVIRKRTPRGQKQVLVSFHWRPGKAMNTEQKFRDSEYLRGVNELLNSPELKELVDSGVKVVFKPHAMFLQYGSYFRTPDYISSPEKGKSFQDILLDSDVLVTDISSNMFEMAYIDRPSISWFPDAGVIEKINLDYHMDGRKSYGNIFSCDSPKQVTDTLKKLLSETGNRFHVPLGVFKHHDMDNSRRLVEWLIDNGGRKEKV